MFDSIFTSSITVVHFLIACVGSMLIGFIIAGGYMFKNDRAGKSMAASLVLLPAIITVAMMLVNGNIGTGLAVAGVFNLVRFRSIKATARELSAIFTSMTVGLACGVGYIGIAFLFAVIVSVMGMFLQVIKFGDTTDRQKTLKITIPESLSYEGVFDDILKEYTKKYTNTGVKTTAMGSLFRLEYAVEMKPDVSVKEMFDKIRERNGNLEISLLSVPDEEGV